MSGRLEWLVLKALDEGEKCSAEIYHRVVSQTGGKHLFSREYTLLDALRRLKAAGLSSNSSSGGTFPELGLTLLQDVYRLTPDGFKELWQAELGGQRVPNDASIRVLGARPSIST